MEEGITLQDTLVPTTLMMKVDSIRYEINGDWVPPEKIAAFLYFSKDA